MKNILCHLAQQKFAPTKALGKHISHCRDCSKFFKRVSALEAKLTTKAAEPDLDLCAGILASISSEKAATSARPKPRWTPALSLLTFSAAALLVFSLTLTIAPRFSEKPLQVANLPAEENSVQSADSPKAPREMDLTDVLHQNKLFQRDAAKLGSHLRKNLILFQGDN